MCYNHDFSEFEDMYAQTQENIELIMDYIDEIDDNLEDMEEFYHDREKVIDLLEKIIEKGDYIKTLGNSVLCSVRNSDEID